MGARTCLGVETRRSVAAAQDVATKVVIGKLKHQPILVEASAPWRDVIEFKTHRDTASFTPSPTNSAPAAFLIQADARPLRRKWRLIADAKVVRIKHQIAPLKVNT